MNETKRYHHGDLPNALLQALEVLVTAKGVAGVSLRETARQAGVSHSAPAHHFGDLEGMLESFALQGFSILHEAMLDAIAAVDSRGDAQALDYLNEIGIRYLTFAIEHPAHYEVMFQREVKHEDFEGSPMEVASAQTFGPLAVVVGQLVEQGVIAPENGRYAATMMWGMVHGIAMLWNEGKLPHFYEDHTPEEVISGVMDTMRQLLEPNSAYPSN